MKVYISSPPSISNRITIGKGKYNANGIYWFTMWFYIVRVKLIHKFFVTGLYQHTLISTRGIKNYHAPYKWMIMEYKQNRTQEIPV